MREKFIEYDGYKFCRDEKTNYFLCSNKINGRRKRLHVYVWEKHNGKVPKGYHVHHKDFDKFNNDISNLQILRRREHMMFHGKNLNEEQKEKLRENLIRKAVPASKEWHKSKKGHEWHKKHGFEVAKKQKERTVKLICEQCGKEYETLEFKKGRSRFCSNKCKSAWRRKMKLDHEERTCPKCGKKFMANKYQKTIYCSKSCAKKKT